MASRAGAWAGGSTGGRPGHLRHGLNRLQRKKPGGSGPRADSGVKTDHKNSFFEERSQHFIENKGRLNRRRRTKPESP
jgi:hypothetical protein